MGTTNQAAPAALERPGARHRRYQLPCTRSVAPDDPRARGRCSSAPTTPAGRAGTPSGASANAGEAESPPPAPAGVPARADAAPGGGGAAPTALRGSHRADAGRLADVRRGGRALPPPRRARAPAEALDAPGLPDHGAPPPGAVFGRPQARWRGPRAACRIHGGQAARATGGTIDRPPPHAPE